MKVLLLTGYDKNLFEIGRVSTPDKIAWQKINRLQFKLVTKFNSDTHPCWQKLVLMRKSLLAGFDYVLWIDADSLITNMRITFECLFSEHIRNRAWLVASRDYSESQYPQGDNSVNFSSSCMLIGRVGLKLVDMALALSSRFSNAPLHEQSALQTILIENQAMKSNVSILSNRTLNSVPKTIQPNSINGWEPGDFIAHLSCIDNGSRLRWFNENKEKFVM